MSTKIETGYQGYQVNQLLQNLVKLKLQFFFYSFLLRTSQVNFKKKKKTKNTPTFLFNIALPHAVGKRGKKVSYSRLRTYAANGLL